MRVFFVTHLCGFFPPWGGIPLGTTRWHCGSTEGGPGPGKGEEMWDSATPRALGLASALGPVAAPLDEDLQALPQSLGGGGPSQEVINI